MLKQLRKPELHSPTLEISPERKQRVHHMIDAIVQSIAQFLHCPGLPSLKSDRSHSFKFSRSCHNCPVLLDPSLSARPNLQHQPARRYPPELIDKVSDLAVARQILAEKIQEYGQMIQDLKQQRRREELVHAIAQKIRQSLDLNDILNTIVTEIRTLLQTDRVILYQFDPQWHGKVVQESVASDCLPILGEEIDDPCFRNQLVQHYREGRVRAIEDIYAVGLSQCHIDLLSRYGVRANLVVPIIYGDRLWGLLIAHQCRETRHWRQHEIALLNDLAVQSAIAIHQGELYQRLEASNAELQRLSERDSLTQVANRYRFDQYLTQEWNRSVRTHSTLSLLLCDVDYFKFFNDTYGHQAGDRGLQQITQAMQQMTQRATDVVARYGGEEFAVILPDTTLEGALHLAECLRQAIGNLQIPHAGSPYGVISVSIGVASFVPQSDQPSELLIQAADQALYQAKAQGRNQVCGAEF
jgi:diguanylate cyclase (GGDEF)-like protein